MPMYPHFITINILLLRTLSFWRALTAECIATFLYSLLVSLMAATSQEAGAGTVQAYCGLVAGLAVATLSTIFMPVSGAHLNPAVSLSSAVIHRFIVISNNYNGHCCHYLE